MTTNEIKRIKFQLNAIADFKDAIDTASSKSSRYISLFSDEKKTNKIGFIVQQIKKINTVSESHNTINEVYKISNLNGSGKSTEFRLVESVRGNLVKSLSSRTPMKSRNLSGAGVELGFNLVSVFKKQLASGLVSLAIVWEQDSLQESIKQEVFFDSSNIKKSTNRKRNMYYFSLYSDSNLSNNIGCIRHIFKDVNVSRLQKQFQVSNVIVDIYERNSLSLPSGSIYFNLIKDGVLDFTDILSDSNFSTGEMSDKISKNASCNLNSNKSNSKGVIKSIFLSFLDYIVDRPNATLNPLKELYFDYEKSKVDLRNRNNWSIPLVSDLNDKNSQKGTLVLQKRTHILPTGKGFTDVLMTTTLNDFKSTIKNNFTYNGIIKDIKEVFYNLNVSSNSLAGDLMNRANGVLTKIRPLETAGLKQNGRLIKEFMMTVGYPPYF